jgi:hypothetical protein
MEAQAYAESKGKVITWTFLGASISPEEKEKDYHYVFSRLRQYIEKREQNGFRWVRLTYSEQVSCDLLFRGPWKAREGVTNPGRFRVIVYFSPENYVAHPPRFPSSQEAPHILRLETSLLCKGSSPHAYWVPFAAVNSVFRLPHFISIAREPHRESNIGMRPGFATCVITSIPFFTERPRFLAKMIYLLEKKANLKIESNGACHVPGTLRGARVGGNYHSAQLIEHFKKYRFAVVFENHVEPGYVTEKITRAFEAGAIPVYLGAPEASRLFNPRAFLHVKDYDDIDRVVDEMVRLERNPEALEAMAREPIFAQQTEEAHSPFPRFFAQRFLDDIFSTFGLYSRLPIAPSPAASPNKHLWLLYCLADWSPRGNVLVIGSNQEQWGGQEPLALEWKAWRLVANEELLVKRIDGGQHLAAEEVPLVEQLNPMPFSAHKNLEDIYPMQGHLLEHAVVGAGDVEKGVVEHLAQEGIRVHAWTVIGAESKTLAAMTSRLQQNGYRLLAGTEAWLGNQLVYVHGSLGTSHLENLGTAKLEDAKEA